MSFTTLKLPKNKIVVENNSTFNITEFSKNIVGNSQIFAWVFIDGKKSFEGEAYYYSINLKKWLLASTLFDETAEVVGVVETVILTENGSLVKLVFDGKIRFNDDIHLQDGSVYFLSTKSLYSESNVGPINFRNLTLNEPLESKPVLVATGKKEAVVVNYRGFVNNDEVESPAHIVEKLTGGDVDDNCNCEEINEQLSSSQVINIPLVHTKIEVYPMFDFVSESIFVSTIDTSTNYLNFGTASLSGSLILSSSFFIENLGNVNLFIDSIDTMNEFIISQSLPITVEPNSIQKIDVFISESTVRNESQITSFPSRLVIKNNSNNDSSKFIILDGMVV